MTRRRRIVQALRAAADVLLAQAASGKATSGFAAALNDALPKYEQGPDHISPVLEVLQRVADAFKPMSSVEHEDYSNLPWMEDLPDEERDALRGIFKVAHDLLEALRQEEKDGSNHDQNVEAVRSFIPRLKAVDKMATHFEEREQHGPFSVVALPGVTRNEYSDALNALDAAVDALKPVFPQVLYGDVFLKTAIRHDGRGAAAAYDFNSDRMYLNVNAKHRVNDVFSIIHEFGHRYDGKFLDPELRKKFYAISKDGHAVSDYGSKDPRENFAEGFAHFVLNMSLSPELKALYEQLT